jgi:hypothetical protein
MTYPADVAGVRFDFPVLQRIRVIIGHISRKDREQHGHLA